MKSKKPIVPFLIVLLALVSPVEAFAEFRLTDISTIRGPFSTGITFLAIHHTQVRASINSRQLESVNNYHRSRFGDESFLGKFGGYNIFIDVDGVVSWFRVYGEKTTAQLAHNFDTLSICMAGNFNVDMPKRPQIRALVDLLYNYSDLTIVFHRDLADRTCPGTNLDKSWLKKTLAHYGPKDAPPLKILVGDSSLSAEDHVLITREHEQDRKKYLELINDDSQIARFERQKLEKIIERLDRRRVKSKNKTRKQKE